MTKQRRFAVGLAIAMSVLVAVVVGHAIAFYDHVVPGMFVGPQGIISSLGRPAWDGKQQGFKFPDRLVTIDGRRIWTDQKADIDVFDAAIGNAVAARRQTVTVEVETAHGQRTAELRLIALDPLAWWTYAGCVLLAGILWISAGLIAIWANPRSHLARTFAHLGCVSGIFLVTLFDFHTTRQLVPLFFLGFGLLPPALVLLALRLPQDVGFLRRWPWLEHASRVLGALVAATLVLQYQRGISMLVLQSLWSWCLGAALCFLAAMLLVRFATATGHLRRTMGLLLVVLVPPFGCIGVFMLGGEQGNAKAYTELFAYPALVLPPLALAAGFVRRDLWGSQAFLSRRFAKLIIGLVVGIFGVALAVLLAVWLGAPFRPAVIAAALAGVTTCGAVVLAQHLSDQALFPSRAKYKPTIEQLSKELPLVSCPEEVARAIERTVSRWLACERVKMHLAPAPSRSSDLSPGRAAMFGATRVVRLAVSEDTHQLEFTLTFGDVELGRLIVGKRRGSALFTSDDLDLLRTIANQGALALAYVHTYQELELRRRQQAHAWRSQREALVETLAAEVAHEIRYPINYFRSVFERSARGERLDGEDLQIGRQELDRLERLVSGLRRSSAHRLERERAPLGHLCSRAEILLRDCLEGRTVTFDIDAGASLHCDTDQITQVLVNLLSNGLQAVGPDGKLGVSWRHGEDGGELCVWDTGPGFLGEGGHLFTPWYTTKRRGTGLGLAITHRLLRAHGWQIEARREGGRTEFVIRIRPEDVLVADTQSGARQGAGAGAAGNLPHDREVWVA